MYGITLHAVVQLMLIGLFIIYMDYRSIKMWEELQTAMDELSQAKCKTGKLH
jgi:hypothetical protein